MSETTGVRNVLNHMNSTFNEIASKPEKLSAQQEKDLKVIQKEITSLNVTSSEKEAAKRSAALLTKVFNLTKHNQNIAKLIFPIVHAFEQKFDVKIEKEEPKVKRKDKSSEMHFGG